MGTWRWENSPMGSKLGIQVTFSGIGQESIYTPVSDATDGKFANAAATFGGITILELAMGDNTIAIPPDIIGAVIVPDFESAVDKTLKGLAADTGVPMRPNFPQVFYFTDAATDFVITAGAAESVAIHWL